ncbi:hypothetical protein N752_23855 [Desulforamulus aquiferis]|nr:helix-turn-helix domain-containing protein [Desulforamulus aquiferis]RYD02369.1 hypothetical protein N752_23855 [Desulforamulus aquiferis]
MFNFTLKGLIQRAKNGEEKAREELIRNHRDYIIKVSSRICKRYLCWENDDELSIALLAFNEAIDCYEFNQRASFSSFAYTVIHHRLTIISEKIRPSMKCYWQRNKAVPKIGSLAYWNKNRIIPIRIV